MVKTVFDWIIPGMYVPSAHSSRSTATTFFLSCALSDKYQVFNSSRMWSLDTNGISDSASTQRISHLVLERCEKMIKKQGQRYDICLMTSTWSLARDYESCCMAENCRFLQLQRLKKDPELIGQYDETIRVYIEQHHTKKWSLQTSSQRMQGTYSSYRCTPRQFEQSSAYYIPCSFSRIQQTTIKQHFEEGFNTGSQFPTTPAHLTMLQGCPRNRH